MSMRFSKELEEPAQKAVQANLQSALRLASFDFPATPSRQERAAADSLPRPAQAEPAAALERLAEEGQQQPEGAADAAARAGEAPAAAAAPPPEPPLSVLLHNILQRDPGGPTLEDDYTVGRVIGKGGYATVRLVEDYRSGELYACKSISKGRLSCRLDVEDVVREVEILHLLGGQPNIPALRGCYEDRGAVHMVMEWCSGGELFERITAKGTFSEAEAAHYFRQMVEVVNHCHGCGVIHRDCKLENFLLASAEDPSLLKACDFGLSAYFRPGQRFSERLGSAYYVAPEVLRRDYGPECDLWSLGVVLYMLLSGMPPFFGANDADIFAMILDGYVDFETEPWPSISDEAKDIVLRLLTPDPAARATAAELLAHPWLAAHGGAPDRPLGSVVIARMKRFVHMNKLKKAAVLAASKYLSRDQIEGLRQLFQSFDTNGDGVISLAELRAGLQHMDSTLSEGELMQMMQSADADCSGALDYEEFLAATINLSLLETEDVLARAFQELDTDGSGFLSVDEIAAAVGGCCGAAPTADAVALIRQFDTNGDGVIDYAEFLAMLRGGDAELRRAATLRYKGISYSA